MAQNLGFYFENDQKKVVIPFEMHNNLIIVPVTLNAEYPLKFILDTGVRSTILIDRKFTDALGIDYQRSVDLYGVGNIEPVKALVAGNISLSMPGIKSTNMSMLVLEEDPLLLEHQLGVRVHGIIGYDLFSRFVVKIDYMHKRLEFYEALEYKKKKKYQSIDLEVVDSKPFTYVDVHPSASDIMNARLLIDTGSSHALVLYTKSSEKIDLPEPYIRTSLGKGLAGEIKGYLGRINYLDFGKRGLKNVIASFPELADFSDEITFDRHGSIGGELLKKYTVIFDFFRSKIYIKPNASFRFPFEYNMSGLEFSAEGADLDRFVVNRIREDSAADGVGFKTGDLVVSLNNIPSKKLTLTKIYTSLNLKEGKKIHMTVYRDGKYISRSFRLKREI